MKLDKGTVDYNTEFAVGILWWFFTEYVLIHT